MNILLHVEEIIPYIPVYHVSIGYKLGPFHRRFDFHPKSKFELPVKGRHKIITLGRSKKNFCKVLKFESKLDKNYILGFNDCRHFSQKLIDYSYDDGEHIDIINMSNLYRYFNNYTHNNPPTFY